MTQRLEIRFAVIGAGALAGALVSGCSDYEFKFNERPIYTPAPLFSEYRLEDRALADCVRQTIKDRRVTSAEELTVLVCTSAGIVSLAGLETFTHVEKLNLAHNQIADLEPLRRLQRLEQLDVSHNALVDVEPLTTLAELSQLNLRGNPALDCGAAAHLEEVSNAAITLPDHCG